MAAAQYKLNRLNLKFQELKARHGKDKIWNDLLQIEGIEATEIVFLAHIHGDYLANVSRMPAGVNKDAIENLRLIYAGSELEKYAGVLRNCGVTAENLDIIKNTTIHALQAVRPHALGLIEAYEIRDESLHSILGRKDGDVYNHMLETSKNKNPINKEKIFPEIFDLIKPRI